MYTGTQCNQCKCFSCVTVEGFFLLSSVAARGGATLAWKQNIPVLEQTQELKYLKSFLGQSLRA